MDAKPRLLDQVRDRLRTQHYSYRTEQQYLHLIRRFILYRGKRHPASLGAPEIEAFLTHLATDRNVSAATRNQALVALLFLYQKVLEVDLPWLDGITRAKRSRRLPVVLTRAEVRAVLAQLQGVFWLIGSILYGSGLRLQECLQLRVKGLDFAAHQIIVRDGKGAKDRVTTLPDALGRKYPGAHLEWARQYVFPARSPSRDPRSGAWRRHHVFPETVQGPLGHKDVKTTQIYTHVMGKGANAVRSPLDA